MIFFNEKKLQKDWDNFCYRKLTLNVRILHFLTTLARLKNFLRGWLLVLGLKEGVVDCAIGCVKSEVILLYVHITTLARESSKISLLQHTYLLFAVFDELLQNLSTLSSVSSLLGFPFFRDFFNFQVMDLFSPGTFQSRHLQGVQVPSVPGPYIWSNFILSPLEVGH